MSIQEQLVALIAGGATDLGARLYPLTAPDQPQTPYAVYARVSANSENVLSGSSGLINTRLQIDVYAATYGEAQRCAAQVDALLSGWSVPSVSLAAQDLYEPDVKLHRVILDYSLWHG